METVMKVKLGEDMYIEGHFFTGFKYVGDEFTLEFRTESSTPVRMSVLRGDVDVKNRIIYSERGFISLCFENMSCIVTVKDDEVIYVNTL